MKTIIFFFGLFLLISTVVFAGPATKVVWDESPELNVEGYYLYYGTESKNYTNAIKIEGKTNTCFLLADIPFLPDVEYYLSVTAYTDGNAESMYSNEIMWPVAQIPSVMLEAEDDGVIITIKISNCP